MTRSLIQRVLLSTAILAAAVLVWFVTTDRSSDPDALSLGVASAERQTAGSGLDGRGSVPEPLEGPGRDVLRTSLGESNPGLESVSIEVAVHAVAETWGSFEVTLDAGDRTLTHNVESGASTVFQVPKGTSAKISAQRTGWIPVTQELQAVHAPERVDLDIQPELAVVGRVVSAADGTSVPGVSITLEARASNERGQFIATRSGANELADDGTFFIAEETENAMGERLRVDAPGMMSYVSPWRPVNSGLVDFGLIELSSITARRLVGRVESEDGLAVPGVTVTFIPGTKSFMTIRNAGLASLAFPEELPEGYEGLFQQDLSPLLRSVTSAEGDFNLFTPAGIEGRIVATAPTHETYVGEIVTTDDAVAIEHLILMRSEQPLELAVEVDAALAETLVIDSLSLKIGTETLIPTRLMTDKERPLVTRFRAHIPRGATGEIEAWGFRRSAMEAGLSSIRLRSWPLEAGVESPLQLRLGDDATGASARIQFVLPEGLSAHGTVAAIVESSTQQVVARMALNPTGSVSFHGLPDGEFSLCLTGYEDGATNPVLWSEGIRLDGPTDVDLGTRDLSTIGQVTISAVVAGVWDITSPLGRVTPLTANLLMRSDALGDLRIRGLPIGTYLAARKGSSEVFTFERSEAPVETVTLTAVVPR